MVKTLSAHLKVKTLNAHLNGHLNAHLKGENLKCPPQWSKP